jgi:hypothetical protein
MLMEPTLILQTSTVSNNNLLYAPHHPAPNHAHKCLPSVHTMPQMNHQAKPPSNYLPDLVRLQHQSLSHLTPSRLPYKHNQTWMQSSSEASPTVSSRPSLTKRLTPPCPQSDTKITSTPWSSKSSTMRLHSMSHPWATLPMTGRYPTSTSPLAVDYTKRRSGSTSTTMALSQAISVPRAPMSNPTLSTSTSPLTTASTCQSLLYPHGSVTCSPDQEATSTFSRIWWPRLMTGAWRGRSHGIDRLKTTSPVWQSKSRSINETSRQRKQTLHPVSPALYSPRLQSMLRCFAMYRRR